MFHENYFEFRSILKWHLLRFQTGLFSSAFMESWVAIFPCIQILFKAQVNGMSSWGLNNDMSVELITIFKGSILRAGRQTIYIYTVKREKFTLILFITLPGHKIVSKSIINLSYWNMKYTLFGQTFWRDNCSLPMKKTDAYNIVCGTMKSVIFRWLIWKVLYT